MGIKYNKNMYNKQRYLRQPIGFRLYKARNIFFFLFLLCTSMFIFSGVFLNKQSIEKNLISTEGIIIKKTDVDKDMKNITDTDTTGCWITVEFTLRNGKKTQKELPIETDFCPYLHLQDTISILYNYNALKDIVEVVSYSRFPLSNKTSF